jgi:hypothetical protein
LCGGVIHGKAKKCTKKKALREKECGQGESTETKEGAGVVPARSSWRNLKALFIGLRLVQVLELSCAGIMVADRL